MAVLDTTIINVTVPHIAGAFAASPDEGTWTITSYAVAEAFTVPLSGWLAARFGAVRVFLAGIIGFAAASIAVRPVHKFGHAGDPAGGPGPGRRAA